MNRLETGQLLVMYIHAFMGGIALMIAGIIPAVILWRETNLHPALPFALIGLILIYPVLIAPWRRYRAWGYAEEPDELHIRNGVWNRMETVVPLVRVQHIDIGQGPIERLFGVCRLIVHTAGTLHSRVILPGLSRYEAERLRDEIRARVGREAP